MKIFLHLEPLFGWPVLFAALPSLYWTAFGILWGCWRTGSEWDRVPTTLIVVAVAFLGWHACSHRIGAVRILRKIYGANLSRRAALRLLFLGSGPMPEKLAEVPEKEPVKCEINIRETDA